MKSTFLALSWFVLVGLFSPALRSEDGFRLPGGDVDAGSEAFYRLNCVQCHTVRDAHFEEPKGKRRLDLKLASELRFVKNYEDLVIAITNPKHVVTEQYRAILSKDELAGGIESFMPDLTNEMSVRQLMDLTAFLDRVYSGLEGYGE